MIDENERLARLTGALEEVFASLEGSRSEALNELKELQIISRVLLQNEALRLDKEFGRDHPRTRALQLSLEQNLNNITQFTAATQIAAITVPEVDENQTLIHGRVIDEEFRGVGGLFVSMEDEEGRTLTPLGRAETDASGYYALVIDPAAIERVSEAAREGVFLTVRTSKDEVVHREFNPLRIAVGDRGIVEVVLKREDLIGGVSRAEYRREAGYEASGVAEDVDLEDVWGIGPKRADRLREAGITDVQALSEADEGRLREILGDVDVQRFKRDSAALLEQARGETR
jgi:helix-hairpin-helix protein